MNNSKPSTSAKTTLNHQNHGRLINQFCLKPPKNHSILPPLRFSMASKRRRDHTPLPWIAAIEALASNQTHTSLLTGIHYPIHHHITSILIFLLFFFLTFLLYLYPTLVDYMCAYFDYMVMNCRFSEEHSGGVSGEWGEECQGIGVSENFREFIYSR